MGISLTVFTSLSNLLLTTHSSKITKSRSIFLFFFIAFNAKDFLSIFTSHSFFSFFNVLMCVFLNQNSQMRPSYHPEGLFDEDKMATRSKESTNPITQLWHMNGRCPEDTIPIRRTKKDDVLRASSVKKYGKKKHKAIPKPRSTDPDLTNESGHQVP